MAKQRKVEISVFEMDGKFHADVICGGDVICTTEGFDDETAAKWTAQDWINAQPTAEELKGRMRNG
jgi:hypothetical protein